MYTPPFWIPANAAVNSIFVTPSVSPPSANDCVISEETLPSHSVLFSTRVVKPMLRSISKPTLGVISVSALTVTMLRDCSIPYLYVQIPLYASPYQFLTGRPLA